MSSLILITTPFLLTALALAARALHRRRLRNRQRIITLLADPRQCLAFFGRDALRRVRLPSLPPVGHDMPAWGNGYHIPKSQWEVLRSPLSKASIEAAHNRLHPIAP